MDQTPLVRDEIEAGAELVRQLGRFRPVKAAYWLRGDGEGERRYLHVALEGLSAENLDLAYGEVLRITNAMTDHPLDPFRVKLVKPDERTARAVLDLYHRYPGRVPPRFDGASLGGVGVAEAYIYPQPPTTP